MNDLSDINTIKNILSRHGFKFSHSLGQNFIVDPSICPKMAEMCGADKNTCVLEIGPGIGVLTKELCRVSKKVVCVEIDKRLIPVLQDTLSEFDNLKVINSDIMKTDLEKLFTDEFLNEDVVVCANLPYYITSPIIMYILESRVPAKSITVMVQKETARRLCANPGERECGAVSIAVNYYAAPSVLFDVYRDSFFPSPNVDSSVIKLDIRAVPPVNIKDEKLFFAVVHAAFLKRRKTILNSISSGMGIEKGETSIILKEANVGENLRAEQLSLQNFSDISNVIYSHTEG